MITPAECREARRLLGWSERDLADRLGVGIKRIAVFESGERLPWTLDMTELERIFEVARIEFANGHASGVRLRLPGASSSRP